ncbi:hypothetical protein [Pseudophaeobacter sp.]|uniref:hypothetical protein n=1 Tax=Pseudophaeobacter sp. TaxID=1971739 RepID=UPI00405A03A8
MQITFTPTRMDQQLTLHRQGDALTINGEVFDFTPLAEGDTLPREAVASDWLASDVSRIDGEIRLALVLPHGAQAPQETLFPAPLALTTDGPVALPLYTVPAPQEEEA